jgi:hypothetical protein
MGTSSQPVNCFPFRETVQKLIDELKAIVRREERTPEDREPPT